MLKTLKMQHGWTTASQLIELTILLSLLSIVTEPVLAADTCDKGERRLIHGSNPLSEKTLIVMIHGWYGDPHETWGQFPDLLHKSLGKHYDVATFGYPTGLRQDSAPLTILAEVFRNWLQRKGGCGNNADYKQYVFVAHSFGGLLLKSFVVDELTKGRKLKGKLVFLIGVPNAGDNWSKIAVRLPFIPKAQLEQLQNEEFLYNLHEQYMIHTGVLRARLINPSVIQELETVAIAGMSDRNSDGVVKIVSARFLMPGAKVVFKNHENLVKPQSAADEVFEFVRAAIFDLGEKTHGAAMTGPPIAARRQNMNHALLVSRAISEQPNKKVIFVGDRELSAIEDKTRKRTSYIVKGFLGGTIGLDDSFAVTSLFAEQLRDPSTPTYLVCGDGTFKAIRMCMRYVLAETEYVQHRLGNLRKVIFLSPPLSAQQFAEQQAKELQAHHDFSQSMQDCGALGLLSACRDISADEYKRRGAESERYGIESLTQAMPEAVKLFTDWYSRVSNGGDPNLPDDKKVKIRSSAFVFRQDIKGVPEEVIKNKLHGMSFIYDAVHILNGKWSDVSSKESDRIRNEIYEKLTSEIEHD